MAEGSNAKLKEELSKMLDRRNLVHAFLFTGGSSESREELGIWLSKKLLCKNAVDEAAFDHGNSADFFILEKPADRENILKDQVVELIKKLVFKPFGERFVVLIKDANLLGQTGQNKLLKTLEEPDAPTVFILLSESRDLILPTVLSRCSVYGLEDEKTVLSDEMRLLCGAFTSSILSGEYYYKKKNLLAPMLKDKDNLKDNAIAFLDGLLDELEIYILRSDEKACLAVKHVEAAEMYIKQGQSAAYSLKQMCLRV